MNDSKIRDEYRDKYHDFISKEIIPVADKILLSNETIKLSAHNNAGSNIGINAVLVSLSQKKDKWNDKTVEYISDEGYYRAFSDLVNDSMHRVKVNNQNSFFDFIAVCIDKSEYESKNFATKEELFEHLRGLIDDKRYINQRRAAFDPSNFPEMNVWRQSEYYNFVDSEFRKKLYEFESIGGIPVANTVAITDINLKQQFIRFRVEGHKKPYVYTSSSKYYKSVTSDLDAMPKYTRVHNIERVDASKIANNDPYFMFILRCLNKDKKAFEPVLRYGKPVEYKEFTQRELLAYFDGFISNDKYKNEYDVTFVPVEVNPDIKEKYVDFVEKEIKPKIKNMGMVSADDDSVLFSQYAALSGNAPSKSGADVVFMPNSKLDSYRKKSGQEVYGIPDGNRNFKFMIECLNRNSTESGWVKFTKSKEEWSSENNKGLNRYLEGLLFYQQCKENYFNNFYASSTFLPSIEQSNNSGLPALPGSSNSAVSTMSPPVMHQAVFFTWLVYMLSPVINPVFNYISNKISGQNHVSDEKNEERSSDEPSSNLTEARELQLGKKGITK